MKLTLIKMKEHGEVIEIKEDIVRVTGFANCMNGQIISFGERTQGVIVGFDQDYVLALIVQGHESIKPGTRVSADIEAFSVPVGDAFLGRTVNALCEPVDGKGLVKGVKNYPIFGAAPSVLERIPLKKVVESGIKIIDMMIPLGKGQRELIVGDRMTGKTTIAVDTILSQKGKNVVCIYCCIGKAEASLQRIQELFQEREVLDYTVVVSATASSSMGQQYLAPYVAASIGEYFMYEQGRDVLVVFDDLTKHAWTYRQISLLLERSPGRDAYPGDIFYLHSQLVERACKLSPDRGDGSMTFLPIVETLQGDVTGYIPSNLISMTDGQIYTSASLFSEGFKPPIDMGLSVSRIGNKVQWPAMKELSGMLRLEYVSFKELEKLTRIRAGVSEEVERRLHKGRIVTELLKQDRNAPVNMPDQVILLYALAEGFMDDVDPVNMEEIQGKLIHSIRTNRPDVVEELEANRTLTDRVKEGLNEQLARCRATIVHD